MKNVSLYNKGNWYLLLLGIVLIVIFSLRVSAVSIFSDEFESGSLDGWTLTSAAGANNWTASTTNPNAGSWHAQSQPQSTSEPASIMERTISTTGYQTITFNYQRRLIGLDIADEFQVEWYNGSTWTIVEQTGSSSADDTNYISQSFSLAADANNNQNLRIKFECTAGAVSEFCRVDDVEINGIVIDNAPPAVTVNSPLGINYSTPIIIFNVTLNENGSVRYTLNNGIANYTMSSLNNQNFNATNSSIGDGLYTVRFYANDTKGNKNETTNVTFRIDTIKPAVSIIYPLSISYNTLQTQLNYTVSDINLQTCWYSTNGGFTNTSITCVSNVTGLNSGQGSVTWIVGANDSAGNSNSTSITFFVDSITPLISFGAGTAVNGSVVKQSFIFTNVSVTETNEANITFTLYNSTGEVNRTTYATAVRTINWTSLSDGIYFYNVSVRDTLNNANTTETRTITLDTKPPTFSSFIEFPSNGSVYVPGQLYRLNVSVNDTESVGNAGMEFSGTNYTTTNMSNRYNVTIVNLAAGTYAYYWWANDSAGNYNTSGIRYYTITKANTSITLLLNSNASNITLTYGQNLNASASASGGAIFLYRDNVDITSQNNQNTLLASALYTFKANATGNQNYSDNADGITFLANITKASPSSGMSLGITPASSVVYGTSTSASGAETNTGDGELVYILYRDSIAGPNPDPTTSNAGTYVYIYNTTGGQNYSAGSVTQNLTVNKASNPVNLLQNGNAANISIVYPQQVNASASANASGVVSLFRNGSDVTILENSKNVTLGVGFYTYKANSSGNQNYLPNSTGIVFSVNVTEPPDITPPSITLIAPDGTYGYNTSLPLNYSVSDANLQSCWYHIDAGVNISLSACNNGTFNTSEGSHTLRVYANDSAGNLGTASKNFFITIGAPSITLHSPINLILNSGNVQFNYTASDPDGLDYCELWGDFNGSFSRNQSTARQVFDQKFSLNLSDGSYIWNVWCIDMLGFSTFDGNKTFSVDTTAPTLAISNPTGSYTSQTGIPLQYIANDNNNLSSCSYNVTKGASVEIASTILSGCENTTFNVSSLGDYVLWLSANDSVGNTKISSKSFSIVLPPSAGGGSSGGGGGGSGGGGGGGAGIPIKKNASLSANLEISDLGDIIISIGEERDLKLEVKNTGTAFLNKCKLIGKGIYESWIISEDIKNINAGEIAEFIFTLRVPASASADEAPNAALECLEKNTAVPLRLRIQIPSLRVTISKLTQLSPQEELSVSYKTESESISEKTLLFIVFDNDGKKISEKQTSVIIGNEEQIVLDISKAKKGLLKIAVQEQDADKPLIEEFFVYEGRRGVTGFAFIDNLSPTSSSIIVIAILSLIGVFFLVRRIIRLRGVQ